MTAAAALAGYLALLLAAFGARTVLHRRRTGSTGWLSATTTAGWIGDGLFTIGLAATAMAPVLVLAGWLEPIGWIDRPAVHVAGEVLLVAGAVVALVAQVQLGPSWRAGIEVPDRLVRHGLYGRVRHPFYSGLLTASLGVALMVPNAVAVAGWLALLAGCEIDVRLVEEPALRSGHGPTYDAYARAVPRFLPAPRRRPSSDTM